eukprot:scaffold23080_cov78-Cyclotella_meneghiniana.AAC.1
MRLSSAEVIMMWGSPVDAIPGFFQRYNKPTCKEVRTVIYYYSGHFESDKLIVKQSFRPG